MVLAAQSVPKMERVGDWKAVALGTIADITTGDKDVNEGNPEGLYPFFTCSRAHTFSDSYSFDTEAILVAGNGDVGNLHYYNGKFEAYQRTYVLRNFAIRPRYLWWQLNYGLSRSLGLGVIGTSIPYIKRANLTEFIVPLPPTEEEQSRISDVLDDADAYVGSLEQLIAKKRAVMQGAMHDLLTGKRRLPGFSIPWKRYAIHDLAAVDSDNLDSKTSPDFTFNYISLENVSEGRLTGYSSQVFKTAPSRARRRLNPGDVLISTVRPNLKSHLLFAEDGSNWVCSTGFSVLRCYEGMSHPAFIFYHFFGDEINKQINSLLVGSNYPAINGGDVSRLGLIAPEIKEQSAIAGVLSEMDNEIAEIERKLEKARDVKQGMMQQLLTGRVRLV